MQLSLLTDFGCPFNCHFCITNSQKTKKEVNLNVNYSYIKEYIIKNKVKRLSISGGGEPLFTHDSSVITFYIRIFNLCSELEIDLHVHTNLNSPNDSMIKMHNFSKIVVSVNSNNYIKKYKAFSSIENNFRFVHVSDGSDLEVIKNMIFNLPKNAQFTVKPMDDKYMSNKQMSILDFSEIIEYVSSIDNCVFLHKGDYNKYFVVNTNTFHDVFKDINFG